MHSSSDLPKADAVSTVSVPKKTPERLECTTLSSQEEVVTWCQGKIIQKLKCYDKHLQCSSHKCGPGQGDSMRCVWFKGNFSSTFATLCWNTKAPHDTGFAVGVHCSPLQLYSLKTLGTIFSGPSQQEWPSIFDGQKRNHTFNQPSGTSSLRIWLTNYSSPWDQPRNLKAEIVLHGSLVDLVTVGTFCLIASWPLPSF